MTVDGMRVAYLAMGSVARVADRVAASLPHAEQRTIAGAGHMLPLTHAAIVAAAVTEHCGACGTATIAA